MEQVHAEGSPAPTQGAGDGCIASWQVCGCTSLRVRGCRCLTGYLLRIRYSELLMCVSGRLAS